MSELEIKKADLRAALGVAAESLASRITKMEEKISRYSSQIEQLETALKAANLKNEMIKSSTPLPADVQPLYMNVSRAAQSTVDGALAVQDGEIIYGDDADAGVVNYKESHQDDEELYADMNNHVKKGAPVTSVSSNIVAAGSIEGLYDKVDDSPQVQRKVTDEKISREDARIAQENDTLRRSIAIPKKFATSFDLMDPRRQFLDKANFVQRGKKGQTQTVVMIITTDIVLVAKEKTGGGNGYELLAKPTLRPKVTLKETTTDTMKVGLGKQTLVLSSSPSQQSVWVQKLKNYPGYQRLD